MTLVLSILGWMLFGVGILIGLALDLVGLFGNWVILVVVAVAWVVLRFQHFGIWTLGILLLLATMGEVLEFLAAGYGAARFGGSRGAALASLAGCITGAVMGTPWFPVVGTLAGAILGAFAGAVLYELLVANKPADVSVRTGVGAALGRAGGVLAKFVLGLAMLVVAAMGY
ncbi:MAG: DUF456 domain-containing protein [Candidatus Hydrogenedentes bacterium]|nr:DUF456 domain-containing protein [Candidatus Hydrogenedentota bacterium]